MKATMILTLTACCLFGQDQPPKLPPTPEDPLQKLGAQAPQPQVRREVQELPSRQGLRVALDIFNFDSADRTANRRENQVRTVLTKELRQLGDVLVTSRTEPHDETLRVLVVGGICTTMVILHTRPADGGEILVNSTVLGDRTHWADFIHEFDSKVLEADRKRLFR